MEIVLFGILVVALMVGGHYLGKKQKREREQALSQAAEGFMLDGKIDPETSTVSGSLDGISLEYRLVTRGSGSSSESWTECEVTVNTERLDIALRAQTRSEERWVEKGLARDLLVGDDEFDEKYIVEAAPAELATRVLSADLRSELLMHHPLAVKEADGGLLVEKRGWLEEPDEIRRFAKMAATLATRINEVVAAARHEEQREAATKGYRGAPAEEQKKDELLAREETAELKALRVKRKRAEKVRGWLMIALALSVIAGISLAQRC